MGTCPPPGPPTSPAPHSHLVEAADQPQQRGLGLRLQLVRVLLWEGGEEMELVRGGPCCTLLLPPKPPPGRSTPLMTIQGTYWCGGLSASVNWALRCIRAAPTSP